jgi:hypothetical protein
MPRPWSGTTSGRWPAPTRAVPPTATCWCRGCPWPRWSSCGSPDRRRRAAHRAAGQHPGRRAPGHGGGHPPVQQAGPQPAPAAELQQLAGSRVAPRLLVGDLNPPSTVVVASRRGWPEIGGRTWPNSHPTQQLDHVLWNNPAGWSALVAPHVCRDSGACSPGLDPPVVSVGSLRETRSARGLPWRPRTSNRKSVAERWDVPSGWLLAQRRGDSHQAGARQGRGPEGPPGEGGTAFRRCADRAGRRGMVDGSWASQA